MDRQLEISEMDNSSVGEKMLSLAKQLFPLNRSIMGPDIRHSLEVFKNKHSEFESIEFPTGDRVFDWEIPQEWNIRDAYIEHDSGRKFAAFSKSNLHIMGYSMPVNKMVCKQELLDHIHTHPYDRTAIPYVTSYYKKDWAFCMSQDEVDELPEGMYRVVIDSDFKDGSLSLQEAVIQGTTKKKYSFHRTYVIRLWQTTNLVDQCYLTK